MTLRLSNSRTVDIVIAAFALADKLFPIRASVMLAPLHFRWLADPRRNRSNAAILEAGQTARNWLSVGPLFASINLEGIPTSGALIRSTVSDSSL